MAEYLAISWESWEPRHEATYRGNAHGVPDPVKARIHYQGKTFCGKPVKQKGQLIEVEVTCKSCLRSKAFRATIKYVRNADGLVEGYEKYAGEPDF
jgi:hypothetical protein